MPGTSSAAGSPLWPQPFRTPALPCWPMLWLPWGAVPWHGTSQAVTRCPPTIGLGEAPHDSRQQAPQWSQAVRLAVMRLHRVDGCWRCRPVAWPVSSAWERQGAAERESGCSSWLRQASTCRGRQCCPPTATVLATKSPPREALGRVPAGCCCSCWVLAPAGLLGLTSLLPNPRLAPLASPRPSHALVAELSVVAK